MYCVNRYLAVVLLVLCSGMARAADIIAPDTVAVGSLAVIEVQDAGESSVAWMPLSPEDLEYRTFEDNAIFVFAAGCQPGRAVVLVTVIDWENRKLRQSRVVVKISKGPEPPGPTPPPPGKFGLAKVAYDNLPADRSLAGKIASSFDNAAKSVENGEPMLSAIGEVRRLATAYMSPTDVKTWANWNDAIAVAYGKLWTAKKVNTPAAFVEALREISAGLKAGVK